MVPSSLLFLSLLLSSSDALPPPRISFLLDSMDRPLVHFRLPDVHNITTLLLSDNGSTLYAGARDAVLSLDVSQSDVISLKEKVTWSPSEKEITSCAEKGKNSTVDCPNFLHVMQPVNSTHLYVCGSHAYTPRQAYIDIESFSLVHQDEGKGRCPFSPSERSSAVIIDEELFTATTTDFRGLKPQISRFFSKHRRPDVNLDTSISLLEEPTFVNSLSDPAQQKLYFFFSEVGKEFSFVNNLRITRVAQVCKEDVGGQRTLQKKWTSFAKASLICQTSKQLPFNIVQDVFTLQTSDASETLLYGVFTSQWSIQPESAVCMFRLQDIRAVFTGPYRTLNMNTHQWSPRQDRRSFLGKCGLANYSDSDLTEVKRSFLTSKSVKPSGQILVSAEQRYSRVVVMRTQAANNKQYDVLFLLTETGVLHKVVWFDQGPRVIEEIQVFTQPQLVKSMVVSSSKGVLYVGTSAGVTAVPVARCSIYRSCGQCVLARDPLCGWSRTRKFCTGLDGGDQDVLQNLENGGVEDECQGEIKNIKETDVYFHLNEVVTLQCQKPSSLATLTWTSPNILHERLFIRSADGSLSFLASTGTFGNYSCEAEEGGLREIVVSYNVRQIPSARHLPKADESMMQSPDEPFEDITTEEPAMIRGSDESEKSLTQNKKLITHKDESILEKNFTSDLLTSTKRDKVSTKSEPNRDVSGFKNSNFILNPSNEPLKEKSYYSEVVVVSLLLAVSVILLVLGSIHIWRQKKTDLKSDQLILPVDFSKTNTSIEICSLNTPEDAGPDHNMVPCHSDRTDLS